MEKLFLYLMVFMYAAGGIYHFVNPAFFEAIMPQWLPAHSALNYLGGLAELIFAAMLLAEKTRRISARMIIAMLVTFLLVIHLPMTIDFYKTNHPGFMVSVIRLPIQLVLIWWAWLYTKPAKS